MHSKDFEVALPLRHTWRALCDKAENCLCSALPKCVAVSVRVAVSKSRWWITKMHALSGSQKARYLSVIWGCPSTGVLVTAGELLVNSNTAYSK